MTLQEMLQQFDWDKIITLLTLVVTGGFILAYREMKDATIENLKGEIEHLKLMTPASIWEQYEGLTKLYEAKGKYENSLVEEEKVAQKEGKPEEQIIKLRALKVKLDALSPQVMLIDPTPQYIFKPADVQEIVSDTDALAEDESVSEGLRKTAGYFGKVLNEAAVTHIPPGLFKP